MKDIWVIEYSFFKDIYRTNKLSDHIKQAKIHHNMQALYPYTLIDIFPSEEECLLQHSTLVTAGKEHPVSLEMRLREFEGAVELLKEDLK
jgi:hypothetical protein